MLKWDVIEAERTKRRCILIREAFPDHHHSIEIDICCKTVTTQLRRTYDTATTHLRLAYDTDTTKYPTTFNGRLGIAVDTNIGPKRPRMTSRGKIRLRPDGTLSRVGQSMLLGRQQEDIARSFFEYSNHRITCQIECNYCR